MGGDAIPGFSAPTFLDFVQLGISCQLSEASVGAHNESRCSAFSTESCQTVRRWGSSLPLLLIRGVEPVVAERTSFLQYHLGACNWAPVHASIRFVLGFWIVRADDCLFFADVRTIQCRVCSV